MSKEKYIVIYPDGNTEWMETEHDQLVKTCYKVIGCDCVESVCTIIPDVCLIVDESGKIKDPPQPHNDLASSFYRGCYLAGDNIVGPAVVAAIHQVDGESDWVPLNKEELYLVLDQIQFYFDCCELPD